MQSLCSPRLCGGDLSLVPVRAIWYGIGVRHTVQTRPIDPIASAFASIQDTPSFG